MNKTIEIYKTLNVREKYILKELGINEKDLTPERIDNVIKNMLIRMESISQLPLTDRQVRSAIANYERPHDELFKGIEFMYSDVDYPKAKINIFRMLTDENKKTIGILGIKLEDKEISSKEYNDNLNVLINKILIRYGTGIKEKECYKLMNKLYKENIKRKILQ